jgi:hypothetical protein
VDIEILAGGTFLPLPTGYGSTVGRSVD